MSESRPSWMMGGITNPAIEEYLYRITPGSEPVLREIETLATERKIPIVGPLVGRYLIQLARAAGAKTVFEMGSAVGYSTIWWALAVGEGGRVVYTDSNRRNAAQAKAYFERVGVADRVDIRIGDALEMLSEEKGEFDIVFNDIDKEDYPRALRIATPRVRRGGLFISDNALWGAKIVNPQFAEDADTRGILEFNRALMNSRDFFTSIIPLRDGLAIATKL